jgi:hypothetical protein
MHRYLLIFLSFTLLNSCFSLDASEEHMEIDCKCEAYSQGGKFYIKAKDGYIEPSGKKINGKLMYGYILTNDKCEIIFPFEFDKASAFSEGLAAVKKQSKWGFIDSTGKIALPFEYIDVREFDDGMCAVKVDSLWAFINKQGQIVIHPKYKATFDFSANVCFVQKSNSKWALINRKGNLVPGPEIDTIENIWPGPDSQEAWVIVNGIKLAFSAKDGKYAFFKDIKNWSQIDSIALTKYVAIPN